MQAWLLIVVFCTGTDCEARFSEAPPFWFATEAECRRTAEDFTAAVSVRNRDDIVTTVFDCISREDLEARRGAPATDGLRLSITPKN